MSVMFYLLMILIFANLIFGTMASLVICYYFFSGELREFVKWIKNK